MVLVVVSLVVPLVEVAAVALVLVLKVVVTVVRVVLQVLVTSTLDLDLVDALVDLHTTDYLVHQNLVVLVALDM